MARSVSKLKAIESETTSLAPCLKIGACV